MEQNLPSGSVIIRILNKKDKNEQKVIFRTEKSKEVKKWTKAKVLGKKEKTIKK